MSEAKPARLLAGLFIWCARQGALTRVSDGHGEGKPVVPHNEGGDTLWT
jgi:hypothetical protein